MPWLREVSPDGIEPSRWTVIFHRRAENWFFSVIAMGHFKHVSALAWIPELSLWFVYDVGFRRTRLRILEDGPTAQGIIAAIVKGNAAVAIDVRDTELPWMRLGMFCTSAVAHLIGVRTAALRPDALYRHLIAKGGTIVHDDYVPPARGALRAIRAYRHLVAKGGVVRDDESRITSTPGRAAADRGRSESRC